MHQVSRTEPGHNAAQSVVSGVLAKIVEENNTTLEALDRMPPSDARAALMDDMSVVVVFIGQQAARAKPGREATPSAKRVKQH